jgi:hypothetical protein
VLRCNNLKLRTATYLSCAEILLELALFPMAILNYMKALRLRNMEGSCCYFMSVVWISCLTRDDGGMMSCADRHRMWCDKDKSCQAFILQGSSTFLSRYRRRCVVV